MSLPRIATKQPRTKRGANRQWRAIVRAYKRDFDGGGSFGWDWPTLRANAPEKYQKLQQIRAVYHNLPD